MDEEHKELKAVVRGNAEFTKNLYAILAKKPGNVFFSPISLHAILSLVYQGARGHTQEAFAKVLNLSNVTVAASGYKVVLSRFNFETNITLLLANKVFLQEGYKLKKAFKNVAVRQFLSEVELLNFNKPEVAASSINTWVENKTNNKIKNIINPDDLTDDTSLVLVNAIYFKGKWAYPFDVQNTTTEKFYLNDVDTIDVQMMHMMRFFLHKNDDSLNAQVLELPYSNRNFGLLMVLPNERNGIAELEKKLANTNITKLTQNMYETEVVVAIPKFKIEQTIDLKNPLTQLGLGVIFSKDADLSGITETAKELYVAQAIQKSFIEVNEEGTEATAAFEVYEIPLCTPPPPPEFTADHPFFIILRSNQVGGPTVILFEGRVSNPQY